MACVLALMVAGLVAQARPDPYPEDTNKCPWPACTQTCDQAVFFGSCTEGKNGKEVAHSYACCCCNEGAKNRYFHARDDG